MIHWNLFQILVSSNKRLLGLLKKINTGVKCENENIIKQIDLEEKVISNLKEQKFKNIIELELYTDLPKVSYTYRLFIKNSPNELMQIIFGNTVDKDIFQDGEKMQKNNGPCIKGVILLMIVTIALGLYLVTRDSVTIETEENGGKFVSSKSKGMVF